MTRYTDIDLDFLPHPVTGDIRKKTDAEAIKRSVKMLVLTNFHERPFQPLLGCSVNGLLFEQMHPMTSVSIKDSITEVIENYEPRVDLISVEVYPDYINQKYDVTIKFFILNGNEPVTLEVVLERTR